MLTTGPQRCKGLPVPVLAGCHALDSVAETKDVEINQSRLKVYCKQHLDIFSAWGSEAEMEREKLAPGEKNRAGLNPGRQSWIGRHPSVRDLTLLRNAVRPSSRCSYYAGTAAHRGVYSNLRGRGRVTSGNFFGAGSRSGKAGALIVRLRNLARTGLTRVGLVLSHR